MFYTYPAILITKQFELKCLILKFTATECSI